MTPELQPEIRYLKRLSEAEMNDAVVLRRDTAQRVLTDKRMELLREIIDETPDSMRDLSRRVERDISRVSGDLDELYKANIIDYEQNGRSKRPVLVSPNVFVQPIVFEGDVIGEEIVE